MIQMGQWDYLLANHTKNWKGSILQTKNKREDNGQKLEQTETYKDGLLKKKNVKLHVSQKFWKYMWFTTTLDIFNEKQQKERNNKKEVNGM